MADDRQRGFSALPPKQRITIVIFLMLSLFVVWEGLSLFLGGGNQSTVLSPSQAAVAATLPVMKTEPPKNPPAKVEPAAIPQTPPRPPGAPASTPQESYPQAVAIPPPSVVIERQDQIQNKYVSALNELQMLKIQKEIAETSQAIVAAKLATATAEKSISDLLSEAAAAAAPSEKKATTSTALVSPPPLSAVETGGGYTVQSVSYEQDKWHAVIKFKNKLYDVGVGDLVPPDRSLVKHIDQSGVTLETAGMEQRIPLSMTDSDMLSPSTSNTSGGLALPPPPSLPGS